jgi:hypothetical protein
VAITERNSAHQEIKDASGQLAGVVERLDRQLRLRPSLVSQRNAQHHAPRSRVETDRCRKPS